MPTKVLIALHFVPFSENGVHRHDLPLFPPVFMANRHPDAEQINGSIEDKAAKCGHSLAESCVWKNGHTFTESTVFESFTTDSPSKVQWCITNLNKHCIL